MHFCASVCVCVFLGCSGGGLHYLNAFRQRQKWGIRGKIIGELALLSFPVHRLAQKYI